MPDIIDFVQSLNDVYLGGIIGECVIEVEGGTSVVRAMDMTNSVFVESKAQVDMPDCQIGIADIGLFTKYLSSLGAADVQFSIDDDYVLKIRPKGGSTVKYVLSEPEHVPSFDESWDSSTIKDELALYSVSMPLTEQPVQEFLNLMGMFSPNSVSFHVTKSGRVSLHGGMETEHNFNTSIGTMKNCGPFDIQVYGKNIKQVLSRVDYGANPQLMMDPEEAVVVHSDCTTWIIQPVSA